MLANNNLKACHTLIRRDLKFHPVKNFILAAAAMLVTAMYSFVFLLGSSVESAFLLSYQYSYGSSSHILYTGLTKWQADALAQNADIKNTVRLSTVGSLSDPVIGQRQVKLAVTDRAYAHSVLSVPEEGRLPEQPGEIALDEFTMDSLGVMHELGAPVVLQWTDFEGEEHASDFTLCGWWSSPTNFMEACAWISADAARELDADYDSENARNITLGVNLYHPKNLDLQAEQILAEQGMEGTAFTTNLAYNEMRRKMAREEAMPFFVPAALVLVCGYLMIYSIVHAAAWRDTQFFACLKALGATPRQLRYFLLGQGSVITLPGLLPGWILGFVLHFLITGRVISGMEENPAVYFLSWQPFAAAALCTLATVLAAYLLPAVRLSRRTPMQTIYAASGHLPRKRRVHRERTTPVRLALRTMGQNRWRTALSAVSLLLGTLLLSSVWIRYVSVKEDIYMAAASPWDYSIADGSAYLTMQQYNEKNQGIDEETLQEMRGRPEVVSVSALKSREVKLQASDALRSRIVDYYNQPYDESQSLRDTQEAYPDWCSGLDRLEQTGEYVGLVIGLDGAYLDYVLEYCPFTSGSFDEAAFASGDYVLAAGAYGEGISTPAAGETVELAGRTFTVLGSVMNDNFYLEGAGSRDGVFHIAYILPVRAFDSIFPGQCYRQLAVDIDDSLQADFEAYLDEYEQGLNRGVGITRRSEYQKNFAAARLNTVLPEMVIGIVLLGIAAMNFINMLVVKTVSRKHEFAVYQSLGMTESQLRMLMLAEGVFHGLLMAVIVVPAAVLFDCLVMPGAVAALQSWTMVYTFSAAPLWIVLGIVTVLSVTVPLCCFRLVTGGSLNERMQPGETL